MDNEDKPLYPIKEAYKADGELGGSAAEGTTGWRDCVRKQRVQMVTG